MVSEYTRRVSRPRQCPSEPPAVTCPEVSCWVPVHVALLPGVVRVEGLRLRAHQSFAR